MFFTSTSLFSFEFLKHIFKLTFSEVNIQSQICLIKTKKIAFQTKKYIKKLVLSTIVAKHFKRIKLV